MSDSATTLQCPVCSSRNLSTLYPDTLGDDLPSFGYAFTPDHGRTYEIHRCADCTHAFCVYPARDLWENYEDVVDPSYLERQEERYLTFPKVLKTLDRYLPDGSRLLDVGCATGDFLEVAKRCYRVEGLEPSHYLADVARGRGFTVHSMKLGEISANPGYDILTLWGVIEHFESLKEECGHIHHLLKPRGLVALWTGDRCSWPARLAGKKWWHIQGQHMHFFSRKSITRLFSDQGFDTVSLSNFPFTTNLRFISKSMAKYRIMGPVAKALFDNRYVGGVVVPLPLPSEMFAIFRKR
jgi:SAM-dependent methyltransferase